MDRGAMTEISGNNLGFLMGDERSPRQMVEFLKEGARLRSFGDVLRQVYPHEDLAARLTGGLGAVSYTHLFGETVGFPLRYKCKLRHAHGDPELLGQTVPKGK